ncbi:MAG: hypothetical protein BroJett038_34600 [Chloroflexota bacterium]|nr:MAG: hypothetical protein BroJett038_34600 [Chloroflexota bacterium]
MPDSLLKDYQHTNALPRFFSSYWSICGTLNRKHDLEQLVAWATRKRLIRQLALYRKLLIDEEQRLWRYQRHYPLAATLAELAVSLSNFLNPKPKATYFRGYAAKFRHVQL